MAVSRRQGCYQIHDKIRQQVCRFQRRLRRHRILSPPAGTHDDSFRNRMGRRNPRKIQSRHCAAVDTLCLATELDTGRGYRGLPTGAARRYSQSDLQPVVLLSVRKAADEHRAMRRLPQAPLTGTPAFVRKGQDYQVRDAQPRTGRSKVYGDADHQRLSRRHRRAGNLRWDPQVQESRKDVSLQVQALENALFCGRGTDAQLLQHRGRDLGSIDAPGGRHRPPHEEQVSQHVLRHEPEFRIPHAS
mmetsp:Transcript_120662/g.246582  ORF Transcript_120662/g.246582 Transcript_120662/m.246582 type:complete len:245 (+) Transcript_120662:278-1012(+)